MYTQKHSIQEVNEQHWDMAAKSKLLMTHRYCRLLEECWHDYDPRYVLVENDQGPCAVAVANASDAFRNRGIMRWLYQRFNLVFRPPYNTESGVAVRPDLSLQAVMPELLPAMEQLCRKEGRAFMTVTNVSPADLPVWQQAGFLPAPQINTNILDLPATYELYLSTLRTKPRSELMRLRRRALEAGVRFEVGLLGEEEVEQAYSLFSEVHEKHGVALMKIPFTAQFLTKLCREFPEQTVVVKGFLGDRLSAAFLCSCDGAFMWSQVAGLNYETARPLQLYFVMLDEMIRWAIAHGVQRIYGGFSNDQLKQRQGFRTEERWMCYHACSRPLNAMLARALPLARRLIYR